MVGEKEFGSYIARCLGGCGCIRFAVVDHPDDKAGTAKEIAKVIKRGYSIERMATPDVRAAKWGCTCPKPGQTPAQTSLFTAQEAATP